MIGLHGIHGLSSSRTNNLKKIVIELHRFYPMTLPVLVTKVVDATVVAQMLISTGMEWIQIHTPLERQTAENLLNKITAFLGKRPRYIATIAANDPLAIQRTLELKLIADYILIDASYQGGTGKQSNRERAGLIIQNAKPTLSLLAGGLTINNVTDILVDCMPDGVDIQSGLEINLPGKPKDPIRLSHFVNKVRKFSNNTQIDKLNITSYRSLISLAITSVSYEILTSVIKRFRCTDIDLIHVDFSDGSVAPNFFAEPFPSIEKLVKLAPCLPYDTHLFIKGKSNQEKILGKCLERNPLLRVAQIHCTGYKEFSTKQFDNFASLVMKLGVGLGIALQATGFSIAELNSILQILDSYPLMAISLITRSHAHSLNEVKEFDLPLLKVLTSWSIKKQKPLFVSVDRDMSLQKLSILSSGLPNHLIVGTTLLKSKRPQKTLSAFRHLLKSPSPIQGIER